MNPFILSFSDGTIFFVGLAIVLLAEALLLLLQARFTRSILTVATAVGMILVIISSTPLPIWAYTAWTIPAITGLVILNRSVRPRRICQYCVGILAVTTLALCIVEAPFHFRPTLRVPPQTTVYVLGDSISAGIGTKDRSWPEVLDQTTQHKVVNLAQAGATVESAITQARSITDPQSLVIVAIGGNDLIGGTDAARFQASLDELVSSLRADHHIILLFELPLFPFQNAYGEAQRNVVRKHGCIMLPKRFFTRVLGSEAGTLDGLHLSQAGHDTMAEIIADLLKEE